MDALTIPLSNRLMALTAPHAAAGFMLELAARLAVSDQLRVLDGGNRFNVYPVARAVRRRTADMKQALQRVCLARAFTCYQMLALLRETPQDGMPVLVIDILATFYDDNVDLLESQRLLAACIPHLRRLSQRAPVVVSLKLPTRLSAPKIVLVRMLEAVAGAAWQLEALPAPKMHTLWGEEV